MHDVMHSWRSESWPIVACALAGLVSGTRLERMNCLLNNPRHTIALARIGCDSIEFLPAAALSAVL